MGMNEKNTEAIISSWNNYMADFSLPSWDQIPDLGLYMEQVITFVRGCLRNFEDGTEEPVITASAVNNYVRKKFMPQPVKKRYYRTHLAYLLIICTLKQAISIAEIQNMIPVDIEEEELKTFYTSFTIQHKRAAGYFASRFDEFRKDFLSEVPEENTFLDKKTEITMDIALVSSFGRMLSRKLLSMYDGGPEEA